MRLSIPRALILLSMLVLGGLIARPTQAIGPATKISISPATVAMTADQVQTFTITASDANGESVDVSSQTTLSTDDPLGTISGTNYTAGKVGTWTVLASYQSFTANAAITVTPGTLAEIQVNPNSEPEIIAIGSKRTFNAKGFDRYNNPLDSVSVTWTVLGDLGTIDSRGVFTAKKIGTGKIQAQSGTVAGQVSVVVKEAPVVANTNTSVNTNTANTNRSNQNSNANTNTAVVNGNTNVSNTNTTPTTTDESLECTTLQTWAWVLILVVFLAGAAVLFALVPVTKIWPAAVVLGIAAALIIIQRSYGCSLLAWWPWTTAIATIGLTVLAVRSTPSTKNV